LVVEASSFQLEDAEKFAPDVAVLLNITPDHLDRHGTMASYRSAKLKIFECQGEGSVAVVSEAESRGDIGGSADVLSFGEADAEMTVTDAALHWRGREILASGELALPGRHNLLNAAAAGTACIAAGVAPDVVGRALRSFAGVAHRLELVLDKDGVRWINDSKATNVDSTITALLAVEGPVRLILGGQGKGQDFSALAERVATTCASVHLIGEATDVIADALKATRVGMNFDSTLGAAVKSCSAEVRAGESVLLSPACASFDQFADFEDRGDQFRRLVEEFAE
jgi:UDP-N-acetylmuramoylalanine--D-glutamate ligase